MAQASSFFTGSRLNCLKLARTRLTPHVVYQNHHSRSFSSAIQRSITLQTDAFRIPRNTRSFWWSKSTPTSPPENPPAETYTAPEPNPIHTEELTSSNIQSVTTNPTGAPPVSPIEEPLAGSSPPITEPFTESTPPDALIPEGVIDTVASHLPQALQYGDLYALGLVSWTPAGLYRWILELINVSTSLPWGYTIIVGAVLARLALFPFTARGVRDSSRLAPFSPRIKEVQSEMSEASKTRDPVKTQKLLLKQKQIYKDAGVDLVQSVTNGLVQIPVTLGMFFGIKKMCEFPVEQLKYSGIDLIPDLTVADPTWILPVLCTVLINIQMRIAMRDTNTGGRDFMLHFPNYMALLSFMFLYPLCQFPIGLVLSMGTTSIMMTISSLVLRHRLVRRAFGIPQIPSKMRNATPSPIETFKFSVRKFRENQAAKIPAVDRDRSRRDTFQARQGHRRY